MKTILFIDGENFKKKTTQVLLEEGVIKSNEKIDWDKFDFTGLFKQVLNGIKIDNKLFYIAKLKYYKQTAAKSSELIERQRLLIKYLKDHGINTILAGRVRMYSDKNDNATRFNFKEKGVDVRIAVDITTMACDGLLDTAIIVSSDSDLQPAVKELNKRNAKSIYVGFELNPNKGLMYTTKRSILIRNSEVLKFYKI